MHVTLIRGPRVVSKSSPKTNGGVPPLALAYIAAAIQKVGHEVTIIDAFGEAPFQDRPVPGYALTSIGLDTESIIQKIPEQTDLIGVSCMFSQEWLSTKLLIEAISNVFPKSPIIVGGEHATADPEHVLSRCPQVTCCVLGEGDETIIDLLKYPLSPENLKSISGIAYRDGERVMKTAPRARIKNIDEIPWPAWSKVPIETYLINHFSYEERDQRTMPMLATRGCPYRCTFCSNPQMWGTDWIARDPQGVVDEIVHYKTHYNVAHVEFYDLTAVLQRKWILEFTRLLIEQNVNVTWRMPSGTRSEALDRVVIERLKESGCIGIVYAAESGSQTTLARIKKQASPKRMLASIRETVDVGLYSRAHFMMGLPGQSKKEVGESFVQIAKMAWLGMDDIIVFPFFPYPGSAIFNDLLEQEKIDRNSDSYDTFLQKTCFTDMANVESWSEYFSTRQIKWLCISAMGFFYFVQILRRPYRFIRIVWRVLTNKPYTWIERFLSSGIHKPPQSKPVPGYVHP